MNSSEPYRKFCFDAMEVVREAAAYVRQRHENRTGLTVEKKGTQNFVTEVDRHTEEILVKGLSGIIPDSGFIAEEGTSDRQGSVYRWVIDPVDGTTNFIHGVFPFAISVGLTENNEVVAGIVYEFGLDELFYAWKGGGAWLNGNRITVSSVPRVSGSLIATGFPYTNFTYMTQFMESMDYFMRHSNGLRRLGSAATDIAYVACGRFDGFYEYGLHPWDIAAGLLLVREAGGDISDFNGSGDPLFGENFLCANKKIFNEFQGVIQQIMNTP
jgi:myo-inositol-1(or 4)-monophosphatase